MMPDQPPDAWNPADSSYSSPAPTPPRPPRLSLGRQLAVGIGTGAAVAIGAGYLPFYLLTTVRPSSIALGFSPATTFALVVVVAILEGAAAGLQPTRLYGGLVIAAGLAAIYLLLYLIRTATFNIAVGSGAVISIGYAAFLWLLVLAAVISIASGAVALIEDLRRPGERPAWTLYRRSRLDRAPG